MKKLILFIILIPFVGYGQTYTVTDNNTGQTYEVQRNDNVGIRDNLNYDAIGKASSNQQVDYGKAFLEGFNNATQSSQSNQGAPKPAASKPDREIKVPLTIDLNNFTTIALVNVTYLVGTGRYKNSSKLTYKKFERHLYNSNFTILNPVTYDKKKFKKNNRFLRDIKNKDWLYLYFDTSPSGAVDVIRTLVIKDYSNKIIYSGLYTNVTIDEILNPIVYF